MKEEYMTTKDILIELNETLKNTNDMINGVIIELEKMNERKL